MKRIFGSITILIALLFVSACTANNNQSNESKTPQMLEVEILVPEKISLNQETILKVQVTQGKEYVEDAKEVKFELWKENQKKNSELLLAEHQGNGIYSVNKTFDEKGTYHLQTHVTARSLHTMPTKKLVVGELPKEETQSSGEGS